MARKKRAAEGEDEEAIPLTQVEDEGLSSDARRASISSASTTSLVFDHIREHDESQRSGAEKLWVKYTDEGDGAPVVGRGHTHDVELASFVGIKGVDRKYKRILILVVLLALAGWGGALFGFIWNKTYIHSSTKPHDPAATNVRGSGKKVSLDSVMSGEFQARLHDLSWIEGSDGEDGLILERGEPGKDYLVVEDVRRREGRAVEQGITLMKDSTFQFGDKMVFPSKVWPSPDLRYVLVMSDMQPNWRHSFTGLYWIFDVGQQTGSPLDPQKPGARLQLATWAPDSKSIVFTRGNDMFLRSVEGPQVRRITTDGGAEFFNGVPDWVYEEEVFAGNRATWWSDDSKYIAYLKTNESQVPTYPVQYFLSRPSGKQPLPGEENYPEVRQIKYPKAGAPNPTVTLQFYDVGKKESFTVNIEDDFVDDNRLITEIIWAGNTGQVLVKETNRESDFLKVILIDVQNRKGKSVRNQDIHELDGGWLEVTKTTTFVPSDTENGRPNDGYIDTVIHNGYDHLAYFKPLDSSDPIMLTSGNWEVVDAPSAVDLKGNMVYFVATREASTQRHAYRVNLDGTNLQPIVDTKEAYYSIKFSSGAGYALLTYTGPNVPWQKVISTPSTSDKYDKLIEDNANLKSLASKYELPQLVYSTINIDGFELNVLERRPRHFSTKRKYPVLFFMYQGPGSQSVHKKFTVDFQSYVVSTLGYIVVTVDGRGTGYVGRKTRCVVRGNLGYWESRDQIAAAKIWAAKKYVDEKKMAIWGWSYGGFMTLKTLEQDGGETFRYGMAVAPVTDWRFYDTIYTERYMGTPQNNPSGYNNASITDVQSLSRNVRFLVMHGVADDNVHFQSTLTLVDELDLAKVENYDMHVFPDSDHSIFFHNANRIVYDKLSNWLVNAFNGEWEKTADPKPVVDVGKRSLQVISAR